MKIIMISNRIRLLFTVLLFSLLIVACDSFNVQKLKPSTNLEIGDEVIVASETVPTSGGTVIVDSPGSEIDGLEILVPENGYSSSKTFKISTAPITNHTLGQYFNPITPLIQIGNGGGYSDSIMEITIPITISAGEIPLGFFYDEITGKLEAIPIKNYTSTSITLLTRHFMPVSELSPENLKSGGIKIDATSNLVISSITESLLKGKSIISSGFKMEVDNWEFVNQGSYLSVGGHCAGQNMTAMWYYFEKKLKGEGQLFGKFSTIASMDEDNAIGYRFCSVIQEDLSSEGKVINFFDKYVDKNQSLDKMKFYAIAGAMLTTGEPQGIGIYRTKDEDNNGIPDTYADGSLKYGGHDLICYQIGIDEGKLYICDPNYPKAGQSIDFVNDKFKPYNGKANGHASTYKYPFVTWYAKTAWIDWPQVGKRYAELLDSTIGNKAPNTFPPYTIWVKGKADSQLKDGFSTENDTLRCMVECPTTERGFNIGGKWYIWYQMFDKNGNKIDVSEGSGKGYTILKPGLNKIGFYMTSLRESGSYMDNGVKKYTPLYVDFKWFNVYYSTLKIDPNPIVGEPGDELTITAMSGGSAPANAKYVWNFGDGSKEVTVKNDSIVKHKFPKEGDFDVVVELYNNSTNSLIGSATAEANITNGILSLLQKMKYVEISFGGDIESSIGGSSPGPSIDNKLPVGTTPSTLVWKGSSFSVSYNYSWTYVGSSSHQRTGSISGTMSANGLSIKTLTANETDFDIDDGTTVIEDISLLDIPYDTSWSYNEINPRFGYEGAKVKNNVTSFRVRWSYIYDNGTMVWINSTSINYDNPDDEPYLYIFFSGSN